MKTAFFVTGVPSSGTRLMVRLLVAAGCAGAGITKADQPWNFNAPQGDLIVFRRHLPKAVDLPPWSGPNVITSLQQLGYTVHVLIMTRDWHATTGSHDKEGYTADPAFSRRWMQTLIRQLFEQLPGDVDFEIVTYESLKRPEAVRALMARYGLDETAVFEPIRDGNAKYYTAPKKRKSKAGL